MAILPFLFGATLAAAPAMPLPAEQPAARYPALWVINDSDTVIYLFGTFHSLDQKNDWFGQAVKTAFAASDELMLETLVPRPGRTQTARQAEDYSPGFEQAATSRTGQQSFLSITRTVMNAGRSRGLSTAHGADAVLRDAADEVGKPVGGLESLQFQMTMYSTLPASAPPPQDPGTTQALGALLTELRSAWSRGEIDRFYPMMTRMRAHSPQTYRTMFDERNSRWAQWIAQRLKTPGTVFVAVGAGHLSGPDSVQSKLAGLGVKSARVN